MPLMHFENGPNVKTAHENEKKMYNHDPNAKNI